MAIKLICGDEVKSVDVADLANIPKTVSEPKSRQDVKPSAFYLLIKHLNLSEEEAEKICEKYGSYGGAIQFLLQKLEMSHEEAVESGIISFSKPEDKCDPEHKAILDEYRRIRIEKGIKEANKYFFNKENE